MSNVKEDWNYATSIPDEGIKVENIEREMEELTIEEFKQNANEFIKKVERFCNRLDSINV